MKKIKSIIMATVAACLLFGFSSCGGEKANPAKDFVTLEINGEIFISSYKSNTPTIVIPSKIKGKPVTTISDGAFNEMTFITSVKLPQGIKSIAKIELYDNISYVGEWILYNFLEDGELKVKGSINLGYIGLFKDSQIEIEDSLEDIRDWDIIEDYYNPECTDEELID